jgi:hypothetical protein
MNFFAEWYPVAAKAPLKVAGIPEFRDVTHTGFVSSTALAPHSAGRWPAP